MKIEDFDSGEPDRRIDPSDIHAQPVIVDFDNQFAQCWQVWPDANGTHYLVKKEVWDELVGQLFNCVDELQDPMSQYWCDRPKEDRRLLESLLDRCRRALAEIEEEKENHNE